MRKFLILAILILPLMACAGKKNMTSHSQHKNETTTANGETSVVDKLISIKAVAMIHMKDGSVIRLAQFDKIEGKYLLSLSGKLNGRTDTIINFTRLDDLQTWKGISFTGPDSLLVITKSNEHFTLMNAQISLGLKNSDKISFRALHNNGLESIPLVLDKNDIKIITFAPADQ